MTTRDKVLEDWMADFADRLARYSPERIVRPAPGRPTEIPQSDDGPMKTLDCEPKLIDSSR